MAGIFPPSKTFNSITGVPALITSDNDSGVSPEIKAYTQIQSVMLGTNVNGLINEIKANLTVAASGFDSGRSPALQFLWEFLVNDVIVLSAYNADSGFGSQSGGTPILELVGGIINDPLPATFLLTLHCRAFVRQNRTFGGTYETLSDTRLNYNVNRLNANTDILLVDTVAATRSTIVLLPTSPAISPQTSSLVFIKDRTGSANTNKILLTPNIDENIDSSSTFTINATYGCVTLVKTPNWKIANYYPSTNQGLIPSASGFSGSLVNADVGAINIFRTDTPESRESIDNGVLRRDVVTTPGIWIVIYAGRGYTGNRNSSNRLFLADYSGIDGYGGGSLAYLSCDGTAGKTVGAVLLYDGTKSYVAGWYNPNSWDLLSGFIGGVGSWAGGSINNVNSTNTPAIVSVIPTTNKAVNYTLSRTLATGDACFFNINKLEGAGNTGEFGNSFSTFTTGNTLLNHTFNGIAGTGGSSKPLTGIRYSGVQTNSALWIISVPSVQIRINSSDIFHASYLGSGNISYRLYDTNPTVISNIRVGAIVTSSGFFEGKYNVTNCFIKTFVRGVTDDDFYYLIVFDPELAGDTNFAASETANASCIIDIHYSLISYPVIAYTPQA